MANRDDLLNLDNNKKSMKKPLIYGAIAFLVFIIGILGFAIYSNTQNKDENVVLPPQIKQEKQQDNAMFKTVPIEEATASNNATSSKKVNKEDLAAKLLQNESKSNNQNQASAAQQTKNTKLNTQQSNQPKQAESVKQTQINKKVNMKKTAKHKVKQSGKYYYVQVAALLKYKTPNKKFLALIEKEGYKYRLYHTYYVRNGKKIEITKILIGPFNKNEAKKELVKIKENITQNAFIFKVK